MHIIPLKGHSRVLTRKMACPGKEGERTMTNTSLRSAIVTGASRGIGSTVAKRLARDGFAIVVNYAGNAAKAGEVPVLGLISCNKPFQDKWKKNSSRQPRDAWGRPCPARTQPSAEAPRIPLPVCVASVAAAPGSQRSIAYSMRVGYLRCRTSARAATYSIRQNAGGRIQDSYRNWRSSSRILSGESEASKTVWRREVNSNCRYRFMNSQTTASGLAW